MTVQQTDELEALKANAKATWMAGDYVRVARRTEQAANEFIDRLHLKPGITVLDVACGNGNLAIPAAKAGATVTGIDIAPNLLDQARTRAANEKLDIRFMEGDAESLPFEDESFDVVCSMFGAMFAPRPELVASELARVCRHGGTIAMANWTPSGFIGEMLKVTNRHVSPATGVPSPLLWGDEAVVRERLGNHVSDIRMESVLASLEFQSSVPQTIEFYRVNYGPTMRAFANLSEADQAALRREMEDLYVRHNNAADGTTSIAAEYLEVIATRSQ